MQTIKIDENTVEVDGVKYTPDIIKALWWE